MGRPNCQREVEAGPFIGPQNPQSPWAMAADRFFENSFGDRGRSACRCGWYTFANDLIKSLLPQIQAFMGRPMLSDQAFSGLVCRVQAGDPDAAAELLEHFEPEIRLEVRVRLRVQDGRVRRALDSMDVIQSVLASFFTAVASGRIVPENPQQLLAFLVAMTRNKLLTQVRRQKQQRRDVRRVQTFETGLHDVATADESPSEFVAGKELFAKSAGD